jgi:hypothetical protein
VNENDLRVQIHPKSVWLAGTNQRVEQMNKNAYDSDVSSDQVFQYRCISTYSPNLGGNFPTNEETINLHLLPASARERKSCFPSYIDLSIGSRVRCLKNKGTQIGIFNGAMGTVVGFCFEHCKSAVSTPLVKDFGSHATREIPIVLVQMDSFKLVFTPSAGDIVPFAAEIDEDHPLRTNGKVFYRRQLPFELSYASTVHKYQGLTANHDVVVEPCRTPFAMGLEYVAISRTTSLARLHLVRPLEEKHFSPKRFSATFDLIHQEYARLKSLESSNESDDLQDSPNI